MKTKTFPIVSNQWRTPFISGRLVLPLMLLGHLFCFLLSCFKHLPGLQLWAALPIINGLVTNGLPARSQTQFLNWNE